MPEALRRPKKAQDEEEEMGQDEDETGEDDTAVIVFPPLPQDVGPVVRAFMMGEGTGSCPSGQCKLFRSGPFKELIVRCLVPLTPNGGTD